MCGRYALFRWNPAFAALPGFPADQQAQWNISPNDSVLIQRATDGQRTLARARWISTESFGEMFHWACWSAGKPGKAAKEGFQRNRA